MKATRDAQRGDRNTEPLSRERVALSRWVGFGRHRGRRSRVDFACSVARAVFGPYPSGALVYVSRHAQDLCRQILDVRRSARSDVIGHRLAGASAKSGFGADRKSDAADDLDAVLRSVAESEIRRPITSSPSAQGDESKRHVESGQDGDESSKQILSLVEELGRNVSAQRSERDYIIYVEMRAPSPELAERRARALVDAYFAVDTQINDDAASRQAVWLDQRIADLRGRTEAAENEVQTFKVGTSARRYGRRTAERATAQGGRRGAS